MITKDFYGNSFCWWTGRIEERAEDPLQQGAVRVRIFGLHSDDENLVPTSSLPWAQIIKPVNGVTDSSPPRRGDFAFGFFQDGLNGQMPVVLGVYAGIESDYSLLKDKQNQPEPPAGIVVREKDKPLNARLAREVVEGTLVNKTNNELTISCDVTALVQYNTAKVKMFFSNVIQKIRDAVRAFLMGLGFGDPSGEARKAMQIAKEILAEIKRIKKVFDEIKEWIQLIRDVIQRVRDFIEFIKSLPEKFASLIRNCLNSILSSVTSGVQSLINIPGMAISGATAEVSAVLSGLSSLAGQFGSSVPSVGSVLSGVPNAFSSVLENPSLDNVQTATSVHLKNLIDTFPTQEETMSETSFDSFSPNSKNLGP